MAIFDVRVALSEILEILEDQIGMKKINISTSFKGFPKDYRTGEKVYHVNSDQKRI